MLDFYWRVKFLTALFWNSRPCFLWQNFLNLLAPFAKRFWGDSKQLQAQPFRIWLPWSPPFSTSLSSLSPPFSLLTFLSSSSFARKSEDQELKHCDAFSFFQAGTSGWSCCRRFGSSWSPGCCCCQSSSSPGPICLTVAFVVYDENFSDVGDIEKGWLTWLLLLLFALMLLLMFSTEVIKWVIHLIQLK